MIRKVFSILAAVGAAFAVLTAAPTVLCEGTIANVSKLPPPGETDYPDCLFTAEFILHGTLRGADFPKRAVLVLWGFRDKKIIAGNRIAVGEKVRIEAVPFDSVGPEISQRQQADDIMSFDLPYFFVESIARIGDFSPEAESAAAAPSPPTGESRFMPDVPARLKFWRVFTDRERDNFHEVLLPHAGRPQTIFKAPLPEPRPAVLRLAYASYMKQNNCILVNGRRFDLQTEQYDPTWKQFVFEIPAAKNGGPEFLEIQLQSEQNNSVIALRNLDFLN